MLPSSAPSIKAITIRATMGMPGCAALSMAVHIPTSARLEAMDRSMHRVNMTAAWPNARMMRMDESLKTPNKDEGDAKSGKRILTKAINANRARPSITSRDKLSTFMQLCSVVCLPPP